MAHPKTLIEFIPETALPAKRAPRRRTGQRRLRPGRRRFAVGAAEVVDDQVGVGRIAVSALSTTGRTGSEQPCVQQS